MPADKHHRAIKKGTGELEGVDYDELTYEGYGPGGVAFVLEILTDNKNRTAGDVRAISPREVAAWRRPAQSLSSSSAREWSR